MSAKQYRRRYTQAAAYAVSGVRRDSRPSESWEKTNAEYSRIRDLEIERQRRMKMLASIS
jgi:hypothetical protein